MYLKENKIEYHELGFFLPNNAKILMLGSFHPQRKRYVANIRMDIFFE